MITLEQIRELEEKVRKAVDRIHTLQDENSGLKDKLESYQKRIDELTVLIDTFKENQAEIEQGVLNALQRLDKLEDSIDPDAQDHGGQDHGIQEPGGDQHAEHEQDSSNNESHRQSGPAPAAASGDHPKAIMPGSGLDEPVSDKPETEEPDQETGGGLGESEEEKEEINENQGAEEPENNPPKGELDIF